MKKYLIIITCIITCAFASAQNQILFHYGNNVYSENIDNIDSISFPNAISIVHNNIGETNFQYPVAGIDSITFADQAPIVDTGNIVYIIYNENNVTIINPYENAGVNITTTGGDVVVNATSGIQDIIYHLSGSTSNGSLTMSSDKRFDFIFSNVNITNPDGAAIKVLLDVKVSISLEGSSYLADGSSSTDKAALTSKGQLIFSGNGTLTVAGNANHAIFSNDYVRILTGNIVITTAANDGIHGDYFQMYSGSVNINNAKTGIDGDAGFIDIYGGTIDINVSANDGKGMKCDSTVLISGGTITMSLTGGQSKGIKAGQAITLDDGDITINGSGATVVTANDPSHCAGLKSDGNVIINNGNLSVTMSNAAAGGKGINADGDVFINGGTINISVAGNGGTYTNASNQSDSYTAACVKCDGNIEVNSTSGNTNITLTVSGTEGKGLSADNAITINGGEVTATLTGNVSKGIKADGSMLIADGTLTINANGSTVVTSGNPAYCTGIKSDGPMNVIGGTTNITCGSSNTGGRCISSTGNLTISGGTLTLKTQGSGTTYTSGSTTDGYGPVCISTDANFVVTAGIINCQSTGTGGRGIKVDGNTTIGVTDDDHSNIDIDIMTSGAPVGGSSSGGGGWPPGGGGSNNYCKPKGLKCMGNITINSGHISSYCAQTSGDPTGEAIESKAKITINGGFVEANAYDDAINSGTGFVVTGGYVWAYARGNDGIDNNGTSIAQATNLTGGVIIAAGTEEAIDANIDRGGTFYINGATVIGYYSGGNGMGIFDNPTYQNGQKYVAPFGTTSSATTNTSYCLKNSSGNTVMIYRHPAVSGSGFMTDTQGLRPPGGGGSSSAKFIFTSSEITSGTYSFYTNPTINGGAAWHGLYIGATATTSGSGSSVTAQ